MQSRVQHTQDELERIVLLNVGDTHSATVINDRVSQLLTQMQVDDATRSAVETSVLLQLGYQRVPSESAKELLRMAQERGAVLDWERILGPAYGYIPSISLGTIESCFDTALLATELGHPIELNKVWRVRETIHNSHGGDVSKGYIRVSDMPPSSSRETDLKDATQTTVTERNFSDLARASILGNLAQFLGNLENSEYVVSYQNGVVRVIQKAQKLGVPITADEVVNVGFQEYLKGPYRAYRMGKGQRTYAPPNHGLRIMAIGEYLGAKIDDPVMLAVYNPYKAQQQRTQIPLLK